MDHPRWNPLNPHSLAYVSGDLFYVRLSKPGPRGGKRPPLWEGYVRTWVGDYTDAAKSAEQDFLTTTKMEITCQPS